PRVLASRARAGADHEIMSSSCDRLDDRQHKRWNVAAMAIEKHYGVALRRDGANTRLARSPVTAGRSYDARAGFTRPLGCAIAAAVINDNHFAGHAGRETFANHIGDRVLLV